MSAERAVGRTPGARFVTLPSAGDLLLVQDAFGWFPFGIEVGASRPFPCGITMPADEVGGWFHGMDRWDDGVFFRYTIDEVTLVSGCQAKPWRKQK